MSTQKAKFELFARLQNLGFTYEEAFAIRRIEMTLHRWAEAECNGDIERDEKTERPFRRSGRYVQANDPRSICFIADREAGALRRLKAIVFNRNNREWALNDASKNHLIAYHQTDPRGCALYLVKTIDLGNHSIDQVYNRGLAVCA